MSTEPTTFRRAIEQTRESIAQQADQYNPPEIILLAQALSRGPVAREAAAKFTDLCRRAWLTETEAQALIDAYGEWRAADDKQRAKLARAFEKDIILSALVRHHNRLAVLA